MKSKWITHRGKRIFYQDFSGFQLDFGGTVAELQEVEAVVCQQPENSVLVLTDMRNTAISSEVLNIFKDSAALTRPRVRKVAVVGVTGFKKVLAQAVTRFSGLEMTLFDDVEQAKEWLADTKD